jgi:hypothetical protein
MAITQCQIKLKMKMRPKAHFHHFAAPEVARRLMKPIRILVLVLGASAVACNLGTGTAVPTPTKAPPQSPTTEIVASQTPLPEPTEITIRPDDVCLTPGEGQTLFISEAGGYCFLLPDSFSASRDLGLDISAVGPTLATFGMNRLALILEFNVLGAPGGAGELDAQGWGARVASENSSDEFQLTVEPYVFGEIELEGVRVGPFPGLVGSEAVFVRTHDTLYSITVYPDRESYPDYLDQVEGLWAEIDATMRFFTPMETGVEYKTERDVCPAEQADTQFVIDLTEGWCALIPESWKEDVEFRFLGRFIGGPNIGEFWPGQPPYANIVIGFGGPAVDITLEQRVEFRMNANGRPDLIQRSSAIIGGFPAEILDSQDGPHPDRVALIHASGFLYSVLGQPFDIVAFPDAQPELEAAWDVIINSIQFFEPYR